ncbi:MAG: hypothetical protein ACOY93_08440 [Bacillota bacterium]
MRRIVVLMVTLALVLGIVAPSAMAGIRNDCACDNDWELVNGVWVPRGSTTSSGTVQTGGGGAAAPAAEPSVVETVDSATKWWSVSERVAKIGGAIITAAATVADWIDDRLPDIDWPDDINLYQGWGGW